MPGAGEGGGLVLAAESLRPFDGGRQNAKRATTKRGTDLDCEFVQIVGELLLESEHVLEPRVAVCRMHATIRAVEEVCGVN